MFVLIPCSVATISVDFSQPSVVVKDILCRRYGCRYHNKYGLKYKGNCKPHPQMHTLIEWVWSRIVFILYFKRCHMCL